MCALRLSATPLQLCVRSSGSDADERVVLMLAVAEESAALIVNVLQIGRCN